MKETVKMPNEEYVIPPEGIDTRAIAQAVELVYFELTAEMEEELSNNRGSDAPEGV